jgi:hypothetical protein
MWKAIYYRLYIIYFSQAHTEGLSERGIENRLIKCVYRNHPLSKEDKVLAKPTLEFAVLSNE